MKRIIMYSRRSASIPRGNNTSGLLLLALLIALIIFVVAVFKPLPEAADCPTGGAISVPAADFSDDRPIARSTP